MLIGFYVLFACIISYVSSLTTSSPVWDFPCHYHGVIESKFERSPYFTLQHGAPEFCDSDNYMSWYLYGNYHYTYITEGWFRYSGGENVPTWPPEPGQCGSKSPIWLEGTYPTGYAETTNMTACMVVNGTSCYKSWTVPVMNCGDFNVAYIKPLTPDIGCGHYCIELTVDPCDNFTAIEYDQTHHADYYNIGMYDCQYFSTGWYGFDGGYELLNRPVGYGHCGSSSPIWLKGKMPGGPGETTILAACVVNTDYLCMYNWTAPVKDCGAQKIMYINQEMMHGSSCARFCLESQNETYTSAYDNPCHYHHTIPSSFDRTDGYFFQYTSEDKKCDGSYYNEQDQMYSMSSMIGPGPGWYKFSGGENIMTKAPVSGACGTRAPLWYKGTYPESYAEISEMTACMRGDNSECEYSWDSYAINCGEFNVFWLNEDMPKCGRYCTEQSVDPCDNYTTVDYDSTRHVDYDQMTTHDCETYNHFPTGWYWFDGGYDLAYHPLGPGQCGSSTPIWLHGDFPEEDGNVTFPIACESSSMSPCGVNWTMPMKKCGTRNIVYISSEYIMGQGCGRFCLEKKNISYVPAWDEPCHMHMTIVSDFYRTDQYQLQPDDNEVCDGSYSIDYYMGPTGGILMGNGWYRTNGGEDILNRAPSPNHCGSKLPIWFEGSYPESYGEISELKACMVSEDSDCMYSWHTFAMKCDGYNVFNLKATNLPGCGKHCIDVPIDPCDNYTTIEYDSTRHVDYYNQWPTMHNCESSSSHFSPGWYWFEGDYNLANHPVGPGQCGSSNPIWLKGDFPTTNNQTTFMKACEATDYNLCQHNWTLPVKKCGTRNIVYFNSDISNSMGMYCGRYCLEQQNSTYVPSWDSPCHMYSTIPSGFDRTKDHTLQPGEYEWCDGSYYDSYYMYNSGQLMMDGWYKVSSGENLLNEAPEQGQCGSRSPVWLQGTYPESYGEISEMKSCMVGNHSDCDYSWDTYAINCGSFNAVLLKTDSLGRCGRYCIERPADPCNNYTMLDYDASRHVDYSHTIKDSVCEAMYLQPGWYRFEGEHGLATSPPDYGHCGAYSGVWINGSLPESEGNISYVKACETDSMYYYYDNADCVMSWDIPVMKCQDFNIFYLKPSGMYCGRYCLEPGNIPWDVPCHSRQIIQSNFERSVNYTKQDNDREYCDNQWHIDNWEIYYEGWYAFSGGEDIPTWPPESGQCGTKSPIWVDGSLPTQYAELSNLTACMVVNENNCQHSWNVSVMNCGDYNVAHLQPVPQQYDCGRYCIEQDVDPCSNYTLIEYDESRHADNTSMNYMYSYCDNMEYHKSGWYRFGGDYKVATMPLGPNHCGSSTPVWFKGSFPKQDRQIEYLTACESYENSICNYNWSVPVMKCGGFDILYLRPKGMCGRYCLEPKDPEWTQTWDIPCQNDYYMYGMVHTTQIQSSFERSPLYTLQPEDYFYCDGYNGMYYSSMDVTSEGWYSFSNGENVVNYPVEPRQCGSWYPIWFNGTYPTSYGEIKTMEACMASNYSDCEHSWDVYVMKCNNSNKAFLKPDLKECGRYCMEPLAHPCDNYTTIPYNPKYHVDNYDPSVMDDCNYDWSTGWFRIDGDYKLSTKPVGPGHCGFYSPKWLKGTLPETDHEISYLKSCQADDSSPCSNMFTYYGNSVPVMKCGDFDIMYLRSDHAMCLKGYCLEAQNDTSTSSWDTPCHTHSTVPSTFGRSVNYTLQPGELQSCDNGMYMSYYNGYTSSYVIGMEGWYRFDNYENIPTWAPEPGQCGSTYPIWLDGTYPTEYAEMSLMKACKVVNDSSCYDFWDTYVMHCDGYNVARLTPYFSGCGRYCMEYTIDPCDNYTTIEYDGTRHVDYYTQWSPMHNCESFFPGWYWFEGDYNIANHPVGPGQCGSSNPIWLKGGFPTVDGDIGFLKGCESTDYDLCNYNWTVPMMKCGARNIVYLNSADMNTMNCGRYCLEQQNSTFVPSWDSPCHMYSTIPSGFDRTRDHTLQPGEYEWCDGSYYDNYYMYNSGHLMMDGWYKVSSGENLLNEPPEQGQCGSGSPLWLQGTYPESYGEISEMKACMVGNHSDCDYSWDTYAINCGSFNAVRLKTDSLGRCGRYCIERPADPCNNYTLLDYDASRHVDYSHTIKEHGCEASNLQPGWYRFEGEHGLATSPPDYGHCGAYSGVWINGTLPESEGNISYVKACETDSMMYSDCVYSWDIPVMKCQDFNIFYLKPSGMYCGRYCLEPGNIPWDVPCHYHQIIPSNFERSVNYTKQDNDREYCDNQWHIDNWEIYNEGWYAFSGGEDIPTWPPESGQCGTKSPIWVDGSLPTEYAEFSNLTACMVVNDSNCQHSWNVSVMNCGDYNVAHLQPVPQQYDCGRYCFEYTIDPCDNYTTIKYDSTRHMDYYTNWPGMHACESMNGHFPVGWYSFEGGYDLLNKPVGPGQCGSSNPIWLKGDFPSVDKELGFITACESTGNDLCYYNWTIPMKKCGTRHVVYLNKANGMNCGRYCLEQKNSTFETSWDYPCHMYSTIPSGFDRTKDHTLQPGEYEWCDGSYYDSYYGGNMGQLGMDGWYRVSSGENILNEAPEQGQCGSRSPLWLQGTYPESYGEVSEMMACMVGNHSDCDYSWDSYAINCGSFNAVHLKTDSLGRCGRYCIERPADPCNNYTMLDYDASRHVDYSHTIKDSGCEAMYLQPGWYRFEGEHGLATSPPDYGHCGAYSGVWINGSLPESEGNISYVKACETDSMNYYGNADCVMSWDIPVMKCQDFNIFYLKPSGMYCGRYCLEPGNIPWDVPCHSRQIIPSNFERSVNYTKQDNDREYCDNQWHIDNWEIYNEGWYAFSGGEDIPTWPPESGKCGTKSPIWVDGSLPTEYAEMSNLTACMVVNDSNCQHSWNVSVMNCGDYNVAHLQPVPQQYDCGRYCIEQDVDPCSNYTLIEYDESRHADNTSMNYMYSYCDNMEYHKSGWYRFGGDYKVATMPLGPYHCGSSLPVWFKGSFPKQDRQIEYLTACESYENSICNYNWSVPVMKCGGFDILYLRPKGMCGRYCLEPKDPEWIQTWDIPCQNDYYMYGMVHTTQIQSSFERSPLYTLQPEDYFYCDGYNDYHYHSMDVTSEGWYSFSNGENVVNYPVEPRQCGSWYPIWFNGTYPTSYGEIKTMEACMASNYSDCEHSWDVYVMKCNNSNKAFLKPDLKECGRYCMEPLAHPCDNYTTIPYNPKYHVDYYDPYAMDDCNSAWSVGWFRIDGDYKLSTKPVGPGQCGSNSPHWLKGTLPETDNEISYLKSCQASDSSPCSNMYYGNSVPVMKCGDFDIMYLRNHAMCLKGYCLEAQNDTTTSTWDTPCHTHYTIPSTFERSVNYTLQSGELQSCDNGMYMSYYNGYTSSYDIDMEGWYRFDNYENIPTWAPEPGQCGSKNPIWLDGTYPSEYAEMSLMKACKVVNDSSCYEFWDTYVMHCDGYNVARLTPYFSGCGRYCMEYTIDPCDNYTTIEYDSTRHVDNYNQWPPMHNCESSSSHFSPGWYWFEGDYNIANHPVGPGQCGSSNPIWLKGGFPAVDGDIGFLKGCESTDYDLCNYNWTVPMMKCGARNIVYLNNANGMNCGRYCLEQQNSTFVPSWDSPCHMYSTIPSGFDRTKDHTLQPGEYEWCDGSYYDSYYMYNSGQLMMDGWYKVSSGENLLNEAPEQGQCGSRSPLWLQGTYPESYGEISEMKACMVGNHSDCDYSWDTYAINCGSFNAVHLKTDSLGRCGRYCIERPADPCNNYTMLDYDASRHVDYSHTIKDSGCEAMYLQPGWYRFDGEHGLATSPPDYGHCGAYSGVWINGTLPESEGNISYVKACETDSMNYYDRADCVYSWDIPVMKCQDFNIFYLKPSGMYCGRYCLEPGNIPWDVPCHSRHIIQSNFERSVNYTKQDNDQEYCDNQWHIDNWEIYNEGWYAFSGGEDIPTWPPESGQCGTKSPIWVDGSLPTQYAEMSNLTACMVVNDSNCQHSWNVSVMNCGDYNVAHLKPVPYQFDCGRYCIEQDVDPCSNYTLIEYDESRHADNTSMNYMYSYCDNMEYHKSGWYRFGGDYKVATMPLGPNHCGSSTPVWFKGKLPNQDRQIEYLTACESYESSICNYNWSVPVMKCGGFDILYLRPKGMCGRYCLEPKDPEWTQTWDIPCQNDYYMYGMVHTTQIQSSFERSPLYTLQPDDYFYCDGYSGMYYSSMEVTSEGWYSFSNGENVVNYPVEPRQCGSWYPIWFNGTYPTSYGEIKTMEACMASNYSDCEHSWDVYVMKCNNSNKAFLKPDLKECGRYCMEPLAHPCDNYTTIPYNPKYHVDYYDPYAMADCKYDWSTGWFRIDGDYKLSTKPVGPGQCGSNRPHWLKGTLPETDHEISYLKTCQGDDSSPCSNMYYGNTVPVMKCGDFDIMYLRNHATCLKGYCLEQQNSTFVSPWDSPCHMYSTIPSGFDRTRDHTLQPGEYEWCDGSYYDHYYMYNSGQLMMDGWYKVSSGENLLNEAPEQGQCGSRSPLWLQGSYPESYGEISEMKACMVGNHSDCEISWDSYAINCGSFNAVHLKTEYLGRCGRYCIERPADPCNNYTMLDYDASRHVDYSHTIKDSGCEAMYLQPGWYRFDGEHGLATSPPDYGHCGAYSGVWINGTLPESEGNISYVKACETDSMNYYGNADCVMSWDIPVMKCQDFNIFYLKPSGMYCGRYCLEPGNIPWDVPCHSRQIIPSNFERSVNYTKQDNDREYCDNQWHIDNWEIYNEGWYAFSGGEDIPTWPPESGQCGTKSPIWVDGSLPTQYAEMSNLTACMVVNDSNCQHSWNVSVMNCGDYNVAHLKPVPQQYDCGRYCFEQDVDPCSNYTLIEYDESRHADNTSMNYMYSHCDNMEYHKSGWYRFGGDYKVATMPLGPNHCGSSTPVWFKGKLPKQDRQIEYLTACESYENSICNYNWSVPVMKCGGFDILYLRPKGMCGRYCLEPKDPKWTQTWDIPCQNDYYTYGMVHTTQIQSNFERSPLYTLQPEDYYYCDGYNDYHYHSMDVTSEGWYSFSNGENVVSYPVEPRQCGSWYPIWFNGTYPTSYGEIKTMEACMASNYSDCEYSWDVYVMKCNNSNKAFLKPDLKECGRYCMEPLAHPCDNYTTIPYNPKYHVDNYDPYAMDDCNYDWSTGWFRIDGDYKLSTKPVGPGQCGSNSPQWLKGTLPETDHEISYLKSCQADDSFPCSNMYYGNSVPVMKCGDFDIMYLRNHATCLKGYCLEAQNDSSTASWDTPCHTHYNIPSTFGRSVNYTLQPGELQSCDNGMYMSYYNGYTSSYDIDMEGWYRFDNYENIPTWAPEPGQCGSNNPIWLDGTYPSEYAEMSLMKACKVVNDSSCYEFWDTYVMHCDGYNVARLTPYFSGCGRYCMEPSVDPCTNYTSIEYDPSRHSDYYNSSIWPSCESIYLQQGWYRFEGDYNLASEPPSEWYCGAQSGIWTNGSYPTSDNELTYVQACEGNSYNPCSMTWSIPVLSCGDYNIMYLIPNGVCGRYCYENKTSEEETSTLSTTGSSEGWTSPTATESDGSTSPTTTESDGLTSPTATESDGMTSPTTPQFVDESSLSSTTDTMEHSFMSSTPQALDESSTPSTPHALDDSSTPITVHALDELSTPSTAHDLDETSELSTPHALDQSSLPSTSQFSDRSTTTNEFDDETFTSPVANGPSSLSTKETTDWYTVTSSGDFEGGLTTPQQGTDGISDQSTTDKMYDVTTGTSDNLNRPTTPDSSYGPTTPDNSYDVTSSGTSESVDNWNGPTTPDQLITTSAEQDMASSTNSQSVTNVASSSSNGQHFSTSSSDQLFSMTPSQQLLTLSSLQLSSSTSQQLSASLSQQFSTSSSWSQTISTSSSQQLSPSLSQEFSISSSELSPTISSLQLSSSVSEQFSTGSNQQLQISSSQQLSTSSGQHFPTSTSQSSMSTTQTIQQYSTSSSSITTSIATSSLTPSPTSQQLSTIQTTSPAVQTTTPEVEISDLISGVSQWATIPTYDLNSPDHQLMFECYMYRWWYGDTYNILKQYTYDILWRIDDVDLLVKENIQYDSMSTDGRVKSTDWNHLERRMGINVHCGVRIHGGSNSTFYMSSWQYFAGLNFWPRTVDISSGESVNVWVWNTVPIACRYNDTSYPCKITLDLFDFNEQFTSGAPMYCNDSITALTKPSMCGLELDAWQRWTWQTLTVNLPENSAADQEYQAKIKLRVVRAEDDSIWANYQLPEIIVNVVNDNVTDDYWWWYGGCFTGTDPFFSTFDWQWYGFHDQGEFVLYKHKTKPIEIHTIMRRFEPDHEWTEHCAVAVRAASDVFIIYGCGKPQKWIIRRLGCDTGSEYLEVYYRWGSYEVVLPTGTRVYMWISLNRRINLYISASRTDRYETEGLCGTWNRNYDDEFTGRDGKIYQDATMFARTWGVPKSDSLFIAKKRKEKLSQSFMYCSCMNSTEPGLSPNVDCSWKETMPVCPPLNWGREPCSIRSKRSTDTSDPDEIDVPEDIVAQTDEPEVDMSWKNGWTQQSAEDACNKYFNESILFGACSNLTNVNASLCIDNCVQNIQVTGKDDDMPDAFELFKAQCDNEIRTNNNLLTENGTSVAQIFLNNSCPFECTYKGVKNGDCVEGKCVCYPEFTDEDCRTNMSASPLVATDLSDDSLCDAGQSDCNNPSVYCENYVNSAQSKCKVETAQLVNGTIQSTGSSFTTSPQVQNFAEVKCPITNSRRKRSTDDSTTPTVYLISLSNNGAEFSASVPVILYDSSCLTCTTNDSLVICELRSNVCVVSGFCYSDNSTACNPTTTTDSSSDGFQMWIIGLVIAGLLVVIIVIMLVKCCLKKSQNVAPEMAYDGPVVEAPGGPLLTTQRPGLMMRGKQKISPHPTKINVEPANW